MIQQRSEHGKFEAFPFGNKPTMSPNARKGILRGPADQFDSFIKTLLYISDGKHPADYDELAQIWKKNVRKAQLISEALDTINLEACNSFF